MKTRTPKTPAYDGPPGLSAAAQALWTKYTNEFEIDDAHGRVLLRLALEAHDRMREAQEHIVEHGAIFKDRFGGLKPNPSVAIERDSRQAMLAALRRLNLEVEGVAAPGRPPGGRGR